MQHTCCVQGVCSCVAPHVSTPARSRLGPAHRQSTARKFAVDLDHKHHGAPFIFCDNVAPLHTVRYADASPCLVTSTRRVAAAILLRAESVRSRAVHQVSELRRANARSQTSAGCSYRSSRRPEADSSEQTVPSLPLMRDARRPSS